MDERMRKKNKGFTLVELLVALGVFGFVLAQVATLMTNTSKLYKKGTYEVDLQTEAQRVVQVMEELMIDANVSINSVSMSTLDSTGAIVASTVSGCNVVTISSNIVEVDPFTGTVDVSGNCVYYVYLDKADGDVYGQLMLRQDMDGTLGEPVLLADYVEYINVSMENYSNDLVALDVVMNNGQSEYSTVASKDIYLRNLIGSGGGSSSENTISGNNVVCVLRYVPGGYDLAAMFNLPSSDYDFDWAPASASNTDYDLTNTGNVKVSSTGESAGNLGDSYKQVVVATNKSDPSDTVEIQLYTDPVKISWAPEGDTTGYFLIFGNAESGGESNAVAFSYCPIKGINVSGTTSITVERDAASGVLGSYNVSGVPSFCEWHNYTSENLPTGSAAPVTIEAQWKTNGGTLYRMNKVFASRIDFEDDENVNALVCACGLFEHQGNDDSFSSNGYSGFLCDKGGIRIKYTLTYSSTVKLTVYGYFYPMNGTSSWDVDPSWVESL